MRNASRVGTSTHTSSRCHPLLPKYSWSVRAALGGMSSVHRLHCCCCTRAGAGGALTVGWQHGGAGGAVSTATRSCPVCREPIQRIGQAFF